VSLWRSVWIPLFVSHTVAGLLGVAAGAAYTSKMRPSTTALQALARRPVLDAAHIAFRFGSAEHSRATLESLLTFPAASDLDWGDAMMAELRLAVLDGELAPGGKRSPRLDAARAACRRLRESDCAPEQLRALAAKLAQHRH
jgi:hypothetical protein